MVRYHTNLLPLNSQWQQVCAQGKPLWVEPCPFCCGNARLRNNRRHLSWPNDLRNMRSGSLPGSDLSSGNRLWHREHLSLLSCCLDHRILGVGQIGQTTCSAWPVGKGRGAMALSLDAAAEVFREAMRDTVKRYA